MTTHDEERWQAMAAVNGCAFVGAQEDAEGKQRPLFNDLHTKSSFLLLPGETIAMAADRVRRKFKEAT